MRALDHSLKHLCAVNHCDAARDIITFVTLYLPEKFSSTSLREKLVPTKNCEHLAAHLDKDSRPSPCIVQTRKNLLAVGHSLGAQIVLNACLHAPRLFIGLACIEPIAGVFADLEAAKTPWPSTVRFSLRKRAVVASQQAAKDDIDKNALSKGFDERVKSKLLVRGA